MSAKHLYKVETDYYDGMRLFLNTLRRLSGPDKDGRLLTTQANGLKLLVHTDHLFETPAEAVNSYRAKVRAKYEKDMAALDAIANHNGGGNE